MSTLKQRTNSHFDDDDSSERADSAQPEDGKLKEAPSTQARKAQNRIAQREFRQRKQQYIRDLEARVEVLSSDKEEKTELTMILIKNLLKENKDLRTLVKSMAGFIGEGLGSCLPRLGLSSAGLDAILNRADTDTAYEAFINLKASKELAEANPGVPLGEIKRRGSALKRKRDSTDIRDEEIRTSVSGETPELASTANGSGQAAGTAGKSSGTSSSGPPSAEMSNKKVTFEPQEPKVESYDYLFPDLHNIASIPIRPGANDVWSNNLPPASPYMPYGDMRSMYPFYPSAFPQGVQQFAQGNMSGFGLTLPPSVPGNYSQQQQQQQQHHQQQQQQQQQQNNNSSSQTFMGNSEAENLWTLTQAPPSLPSSDKSTARTRLHKAVERMISTNKNNIDGPAMSAEEIALRRGLQRELMENMDGAAITTQCLQLITYHLNNFFVNHNYVLPPSMRPTVIQRTIPHEHCIDGCLFPTVRDRMILYRGRYDLVEAVYGILQTWLQRGDDPLDHNSWEIPEEWINNFPILCDDEVINISNKWRAQRGDPPLRKPSGNGSPTVEAGVEGVVVL